MEFSLDFGNLLLLGYLGGNNSKKAIYSNKVQLSNLGEVISKSITNSISTILNIGGFIVIFSVIISILKHSNFMLLLAPFIEFFKIPSRHCGKLYSWNC